MNFRITGILFLLFSLMSLPMHAQRGARADSLEALLGQEIPDSVRIDATADLVQILLKEKALKDAAKWIEDALNRTSGKGLGNVYKLHFARADVLYYRGKIGEAQAELEYTMGLLKENGNLKGLAKATNFMAYLYLQEGDISRSIETYLANIEFIRRNGLNELLPGTYDGLSVVYRVAQDTEERRKCLFLMADAALKIDDKRSAAMAYMHLGDIGMEMDSAFTYAIELYKKSLNQFKEIQDTAMISFVLLRIGWNYYLNKDLDTALDYFFYSLEYSIPINRLKNITNAYGNIGTIYRDKMEYEKATKFYKKSIEYSYKAKDWYNLSWLHYDMSTMNVSQGDYKLAYENHVLHKQFSDSLEMMKYNERMATARTRYEAEKAEKELELVSVKLNQQKYLTYGFAGLMALVLVIGLLVFRQSRENAKRRISEMNHKISEITQKNLRQQMNPHFIFNTLNSIQYYMYQHDKISTNNYLTKFSLLMRKTLENSQHTAIPIKDELDALQLYLELESLRFKEKFDYKISVDDEIDTLLLKIPTMLIQPYVENSISHGLVNKSEKGYVNIDLKMKEDNLVCTIEDNGIGRKAAMKIKEQKNGNHNSLGTKITESRLNLVNSLYGKNMRIDYEDLDDSAMGGTGTRVRIYIPIMT